MAADRGDDFRRVDQGGPGDGYEVSFAPERLQLDVVHGFLSHTYWAEAIPRATVERSIAGSLCAGLYFGAAQVGFARAITDRATFAYLGDVFVLEAHRGRGLSKRLVRTLLAHPDLQGLRRMMLVTRDAQSLYTPFGFSTVAHPERTMEAVVDDPYGARR